MKKLLVFVTFVLMVVVSACSANAAAQAPAKQTPKPIETPPQPILERTLPEIKIDAADFAYSAPESIQAGWTRVTLVNTGAEPHHVQFLRLNDGVTFQQFEDALKKAEGPALAMTRQVGGVGAVHPGGSASAVIHLVPGEYVILCFIPSPSDHVAHHAKGMIKNLSVKAASGPAAQQPKADLTVRMKDFAYDMPDSLPAGPLTIQVINDGPEAHEFNILKLEAGKTKEDVIQFLSGAGGPPPFAPIGGMNGLDTGETGYAVLNLEPGDYVAICNIPSPKAEGHPHFTLGMIKEFSVGSAMGAELAASQGNGFPSGKFVRTDDQSRSLQFDVNGGWAALAGAQQMAKGTYRIEDDTYIEETNTVNCAVPMRYKFRFDGVYLKFSPVDDSSKDSCDGRRADFNDTVTWMLVK